MTPATPKPVQRFCIVIPVFQHVAPLANVLASLDTFALPCIIVDDGNPIPITDTLRTPLSTRPWAQVLRLAKNMGKGAASLAGFRWAAEHGYSHTILLDADGQHNVLDIPRVLNLSRANPDALILGRPLFDQNAPWSRRWGRLLTSAWTWVETLSFDIGDPLYGFRCYPLAPVLRLVDKVSFGLRMDFDPEIAVRLYWAGVPVVNFETNVCYPPQGVSNFHLWRDNGAITWMHTRLFFGMIRQLVTGKIRWGGPVKTKETNVTVGEEGPLWRKGRERGAFIGMFLTVWAHRLLGRWIAEIILWFVVTYFFITGRTGRQASRDYLSRVNAVRGEFAPPTLKDIHAHFMNFAQTSLDRFDVWTGNTRRYHYTFKGRDHLDRLVSAGQGAVLFGAHFGNSDALRALIEPSLAKVHFLTDQRGSQKFFSVLQRFCPRMMEGAAPYDARHPENVIALKTAVDRGEFVGLLADRNVSETGRGSRRVVRVPFLGSRAAFPQSPFLFASLLRCPVLFIAGVRRARWEYDLIVEPLADRIDLPEEVGPERDQRIETYVRDFAQKLESYVVQFPTQWFNFYDFWRA